MCLFDSLKVWDWEVASNLESTLMIEHPNLRHSISFLDKISLFKSQGSCDSTTSESKSSDLSKQKFFASFKSNDNKKSIMEKEWSKACGQMDRRAQMLQAK